MIGHIAPALAGKKFAPGVSLGTLIFAGLFLDILWPIFNISGIEHFRIVPGITKVNALDLYDFPYSHGLIFSVMWAFVFGAVYYAIKKDRRNAIVISICVFSHWILDFISHIKDLPVLPGLGPKMGLGLWNSVVGTITVEYGLFIVGIIIYFMVTKRTNILGLILPVILIVILTLSYISGFLVPPPPDANIVNYISFFQILYIMIGYWTDKNRAMTA